MFFCKLVCYDIAKLVFIGNEFKGQFDVKLRAYNIKHILTSSPEIKANFIERFHRTFRDKLKRRITFYKDSNWTNNYQNLIDSYNSTPHTSLNGLAPNEISSHNSASIFYHQYSKYFNDAALSNYKVPVKYKVGDLVRVGVYKKFFKKLQMKLFQTNYFILLRLLNLIQ